MLLKYFSNTTKTNEASNTEQENKNEYEIIETSACSSKENDSSILAVMDALNQSISSNSYSNNNLSEANCESSSSSKMPAHQNIMSLLKNQKPKVNHEEDSDADVDVDVLIDDNQSSLIGKGSSEKRVDYLNKVPADLILEDVDYVMCEKCKKRILCWDMPEHEDFHFAQTISRQISSTLGENSEQNMAKKRPVEEISTNQDIKEKKLLNVKSNNSKKIKVELAQTSNSANSNKSNVKPIDNYFKKQNKN